MFLSFDCRHSSISPFPPSDPPLLHFSAVISLLPMKLLLSALAARGLLSYRNCYQVAVVLPVMRPSTASSRPADLLPSSLSSAPAPH